MIPISKKYARSDPGSNGNVDAAPVPRVVGQIARRAYRRVQIRLLAGAGVQIRERARRISRNFGRNSGVGCRIGPIEAGNPTVALLNPGVQEPATRLLKK